MANAFSESQKGNTASKPAQTVTATPAKAPRPNMPAASKVLAQHAIAKTQSNVTEIQRVGAMRTEVVLQTFDDVMSQSDRDIIEGLEQRMGAQADSFFGDVESQFAALASNTAKVLPVAS
ncbi:hypothetical protein IQ266_18845 [filamentous cyanobacterium LEGE 11480]|uniref:Uncharacterized protein n=1 Tax=Romeriopsis navalis LEGE 11480 TaxID=2777977 RepID=A0A928VRU1_9CYAN|nr:hypothetical protein [Romeriopsis navalis]MBE9031796.1 hypothetical protein [Romeriopsis navalis LEGE 11480]